MQLLECVNVTNFESFEKYLEEMKRRQQIELSWLNKLKLYFLQNAALNEKTLFHIFDYLSNVEYNSLLIVYSRFVEIKQDISQVFKLENQVSLT